MVQKVRLKVVLPVLAVAGVATAAIVVLTQPGKKAITQPGKETIAVAGGIAPPASPSVKSVPPELTALRKKWGRKKFSQHDEETLIRDFFSDRRDGVFVDVGASHYRTNSTTYYLDKELGWSGVAVDALEHFRSGYEKHRPKTKFFSFFVSDRSDEKVDFYVVKENDRLSSGSKVIADRHQHNTVKAQTVTLNRLLKENGIEKINFLSMDIELGEPAALRGFDIERFRPELVCIEGHPEVIDQIRAYFARHGYVELKKYSDIDTGGNRYFTPARLTPRGNGRGGST